MRIILIVAGFCVFALSAWGTTRLLGPADGPASFAMWKWRAGEPFDSFRERGWQEQRLQFSCHPLADSFQLCELRSPGIPVTGVPGELRVVVDPAGTTLAVHFRPVIDSTRLLTAARRIVADWKLDADTITTAWSRRAAGADHVPIGEGSSRSTWRDAAGRYTASLREHYDTPLDLVVADAPALAQLAERSSSAARALAALGFIAGPGAPSDDSAR